ncbi:SixA phosphatase family protein [Pontibacter vulgaris]|uniref:SixA phosphatase family protein n=1 Tax=Pontibacter vulgaris TaxID=2905679 RepID=UPI001FA6C7C0|nr:histidine phosphatase family protein [Pontibacter vulgaris]
MKVILRLPFLLVLLLAGLFSCRTTSSESEAVMSSNAAAAPADSTIIYIVRHAEKDISNPDNQDPDLTEAGKARVEAFRALMQGQQVDALFATKYIRTQNTLKPLADERNLAITQYEAHDFNGLKTQILTNYSGKTVVVAGHSNTLLPIIEAFGGKRPVSDISDHQYDYLFRLALAPDNGIAVKTAHFGTPAN